MKKILVASMVMLVTSAMADFPIKDGQKIGFMGDSITAGGARGPAGYCFRVVDGLKQLGVNVTPVYAGKGGHKSNMMLGRLENDVLSKNVDWMTLSCGVNDVWHGDRGVKLEAYKENITKIVDTCQAKGVKVMLLTSTMIGEDAENDNNQKLAPYNAFLVELAKKKGCLLADLNADMQAAINKDVEGNQLTRDGVHMNSMGDLMMATGVMKAFGLSDAQMTKVRDHWLDVPNAAQVNAGAKLTQRQYIAVQKKAHAEGKSTDAWLRGKVDGFVKELLAE
jgi:lysophospholipase L1-like esterase